AALPAGRLAACGVIGDAIGRAAAGAGEANGHGLGSWMTFANIVVQRARGGQRKKSTRDLRRRGIHRRKVPSVRAIGRKNTEQTPLARWLARQARKRSRFGVRSQQYGVFGRRV